MASQISTMRISLIEDNPLRVLGVFSNATLREIEKNKAQLRAFARIGQKVQLPLWLNGLSLLPQMPDMSDEQLAQAEARLALRNDRKHYARFWFERDDNHSQEDQEALSLLNNNLVDEARQLWTNRNDHAAQKNLLLLAVILDNWNEIAVYATKCFEGDILEFRLFMDAVAESSPEANSQESNELLSHFTKEPWKTEMEQLLVNCHKRILDETIDRLKRTETTDVSLLRNEIDVALAEMNHVEALKNLRGSESIVYAFYANETAKVLCKAICQYSNLYNTWTKARWALKYLNELWGYMSQNDSEYHKLCSMKSEVEEKAKMPDFIQSILGCCLFLVEYITIIAGFVAVSLCSSNHHSVHNEKRLIPKETESIIFQMQDTTVSRDSLEKIMIRRFLMKQLEKHNKQSSLPKEDTNVSPKSEKITPIVLSLKEKTDSLTKEYE